MRIDRRRALALLGLGAAGPAVAQAPARYAGAVAFEHGVASGDPLADRVMLWTRITPADPKAGDVAYSWTLNPVDRRAGGAKSGHGVTGPGRDWTVKVDVAGLDAGRAYSFEFTANGATSPMGRTATLPSGATKDVVLAVASCSLYPNGYFNAYEAIAKLPRVDAVLHLGDYIYEYGGPESYGMNSPVAAERPHDPDREIVSLDDYRRRHAQYKSDPQLQAAHARAPWIVVWDDHETANDSFMSGAQNHQSDEGDWNARKARAIKAYYEWMPIREPADGGAAINRAFQFGDLMSLFMVETRLTARDQQLNYDRDLPAPGGPAEIAAFKAKLNDPGRRMMGEAQEAWLAAGLKDSVKSGRTWQVLGNEVVMGRLMAPSLKKELGEARLAEIMAKESPASQKRLERLERLSELDLPYGLDMWDGYPGDRERVYDAMKAAGARAIVLSGDSHAFWANELHDAGSRRVAAEFGTTGVTSPGAGDTIKAFSVGEVFASANREVVFSDQAAKGFVLLSLSREEAKAELVAVSTIIAKPFETRVIKTFVVKPEAMGVSGLSEV